MDKKNFAYGFIAYFIIITYWFWSNNDSLIQSVSQDGLKGLFYYFLSNIQYGLIIVSIFIFNTEAGFIRNIIGSFLIIFALDIVSMPRLLASGMSTDIGMLASSDGLLFKYLLSLGYSYNNVHIFYYLVLPILMVVIAINVLGFARFIETAFGKKI